MLGKKKKRSEKFNVNILRIVCTTYFSSGKLAWHIGSANWVAWSPANTEVVARMIMNSQDLVKILFLSFQNKIGFH